MVDAATEIIAAFAFDRRLWRILRRLVDRNEAIRVVFCDHLHVRLRDQLSRFIAVPRSVAAIVVDRAVAVIQAQ
jgi:hypothetical protein